MIDHKAEAEAIMNHYGSIVNEPHGAAQVHATLYLAEQQRVANLIAVYAIGPVWPNALYELIGLEIAATLTPAADTTETRKP